MFDVCTHMSNHVVLKGEREGRKEKREGERREIMEREREGRERERRKEEICQGREMGKEEGGEEARMVHPPAISGFTF